MRYLDAVAGKPLDRPPVWLMRQAGRYLPEYRELRERVSFEDAVARPELASELTLQPMRRFPLDAAIVFADIMTPLQSMGIEVAFDPGPRLPRPVQDAGDLTPFEPAGPAAAVYETIRIVRAELTADVAVIGFCGGPFTLAAYLCEGGGSDHDFPSVRALGYERPATLAALLAKLADAMSEYLLGQIEAGADAIQVFDSWAGLLSVEGFETLSCPALEQMLDRIQGRVPVTYFAPGATHLHSRIGNLGFDVVGVDWRSDIIEAWETLGSRAIQGNIDPAVLLAGPDATRAATSALLGRAAGRPGHIVNLGHGVRPSTPVESVAALVETVTRKGS